MLEEADELPNPPELAQKYPLHAAVASMSDADAVNFLQKSSASDLASIHALDFAGNTPLHIAAVLGKIEAVRCLLAIGGPQDTHVMNYAGSTPLQALHTEALGMREFFRAMIAPSGILKFPSMNSTTAPIHKIFTVLPWPGYGREICLTIVELMRAMGKPVPSVLPGVLPPFLTPSLPPHR